MISFRFQLQQFEFCSTILSGIKKNWWKGITQTIPKQYLQKLKLCLHTVKPVQSHVLSHQDLEPLNVKYVTWLYPRPWVFTFLHTFHAFNYFDVSCYECFISYTFLVHKNQCCQLFIFFLDDDWCGMRPYLLYFVLDWISCHQNHGWRCQPIDWMSFFKLWHSGWWPNCHEIGQRLQNQTQIPTFDYQQFCSGKIPRKINFAYLKKKKREKKLIFHFSV